jgi:hypothetical protein
VVFAQLLHGHLASLVCDLVGKQHERQWLLHLLKLMHLIERHDNLIIAYLVHNTIDLLMITTLCLSFTLKETDDVSWREYTNLLGVSILSFLLLFGLSSFQMQ